MNRQFAKEELERADKHKKLLTLLGIKGMHIKTTVRNVLSYQSFKYLK